MDFDLSYMSVSSILMVGQDSDLDEESADRRVSDIFERNHNPAIRFVQIDQLHFLQVLEVIPSSDRDPVRSVAFVQLVVCIDTDISYTCLPPELDVHQVWLRTI